MRLLTLIFLLFFAIACTSQPLSKEPMTQMEKTQIIIGFSKADTDPRDSMLISEIASLLDAEIVFLRQISGNAAVYRVKISLQESEFSKKLQQLGQHDDIRYAEFDQVQTIQAPP